MDAADRGQWEYLPLDARRQLRHYQFRPAGHGPATRPTFLADRAKLRAPRHDHRQYLGWYTLQYGAAAARPAKHFADTLRGCQHRRGHKLAELSPRHAAADAAGGAERAAPRHYLHF